MKSRLHCLIFGRVQGVFFRNNTKNVAIKLGLTGWVRNLNDGSVEVVAEGDKEKLKKLISFIKKGPNFAKVSDIKINWYDYKHEFDSFEIKY